MVSGKVTLQGKPVCCGSVILYCEDKQIVRGVIDPDGRYSIPNVPMGRAVVTVRSHPPLPIGFETTVDLPPTRDGPILPGHAIKDSESVTVVPERYGVPEESGLRVQVSSTQVEFDIDLIN
jgi:hypothetical protein